MTVPRWLSDRRVWLFDGALGVMAFVSMALVSPGPLWLAAGVSIGLALRTRAPLGGYLLGTAALMAGGLLGVADPVAPYANVIGIHALGAYTSVRRSLFGPLLVVPGVVAYNAQLPGSAVAIAGNVFFWLLAWAVGFATARARERSALLNRAAVAEERTRMARELHDLVGHTVNVMLVQAGASRVVLDSDPAKAKELLIAVERTGRDALDELDRVLSALRPDDPDLTRLASRMTEAGMAVDLRVEVGGLPGPVEFAVYRIVQEALTNALTHGHARSASVSVLSAGEGVAVEVADQGRGPRPGYRVGRGLTGIAERAEVLGGSVVHGGGDGGGFRLRVVLPLT
ncbi:sensor histidine kinase [Actinokineospora globicatena]|uniref:histidine kinase n=1 Tax=Actinokineospora globicatena TaxID=103729 RepID=A0A9W6QMC0_9PSEU|nr:histidine kinase [Actinokineospora globicatena]MCP2305788.1 Signal transduction histidine kinase [Actinokineospora globicatena]GLW80357.1 two-component sensor histidine kinase [Actinokineospora globicatena]GLW87185.1 two-component sensor histidine kinase [Actinokineospora globicatena]GLW93541.1 two-component sensor histidine kinase [Actinokineospora globicatena]